MKTMKSEEKTFSHPILLPRPIAKSPQKTIRHFYRIFFHVVVSIIATNQENADFESRRDDV